jgi:hypothetical protein
MIGGMHILETLLMYITLNKVKLSFPRKRYIQRE